MQIDPDGHGVQTFSHPAPTPADPLAELDSQDYRWEEGGREGGDPSPLLNLEPRRPRW